MIDPATADPFRADCENVNEMHCLLPWPSSTFLVEDSTTGTGRRIQLPAGGMPESVRQQRVDPAQWHRFDGFSPMTPIMTSFRGLVDTNRLVDENHIGESLGPMATTVILDAETGERVPHWAELDEWPDTQPTRAPLYLRPAVRLQENRRYIVAIRGLTLSDGSAIEPSEYFSALRDNRPLDGTNIDDERARFEDIFSLLDNADVARDGLIEAWDFHTASDRSLWQDLISMRDDAVGTDPRGSGPDGDYGRVGERGLGCTVSFVQEGDELPENVWRHIEGTVTVPLYTRGPGTRARDALLNRDPDGRPEANGTAEVRFMFEIPRSVYERVREGGDPARLQVYGHGLFSQRSELTAGWQREHQDRLGLVTVGVDWWGMSDGDVGRVLLTLSQDFSTLQATSERLHQGVINVLAMSRSFQGVCSELPAFQIPLADGRGEAPAINTEEVYYYGNSQGGIMGSVVAGVSNDIERFTLGVGGMSYPLMILRSTNWTTYGSILQAGYTDPLERSLLMTMSAVLWDTAEPSTYTQHLVHDPLPNTIPKRVLMQIGVGDAQVPNLAADLQARTMGIPYVTPSPLEPWNLPSASLPLDSGMVIFPIDGCSPQIPGTRKPEGNNAHEGVRRLDEAMAQIDRFMRPDGRIE